MSEKQPEAASPEAAVAGAAPAASGGIKAWLPLLVTIVVMPLLAFATTKFVILPKVLHARGAEGAAGEEGQEEAKAEPKDGKEKENGESKKEEHGGKAEKPEKGKEGKDAKGKKQTAQLTKIIVNVSGSMGTRYLMSSITLVGSRTGFKEMIEENKDQLLDLANTALASRTISDLEKPGSRNLIRSELMSVFNNALGANAVQEIYFTEFAIQ